MVRFWELVDLVHPLIWVYLLLLKLEEFGVEFRSSQVRKNEGGCISSHCCHNRKLLARSEAATPIKEPERRLENFLNYITLFRFFINALWFVYRIKKVDLIFYLFYWREIWRSKNKKYNIIRQLIRPFVCPVSGYHQI
ncbi:hypothetical protein RHMOL_Rhmol07G0147600 [Rhododendron molle]|uniref:Uncharacterized protein n=1 Tax=Rhododendron molle TaxID=49168 RepID=A0ACC0N0M1_RHOML|nr:hypothetical protein RHMOL_Rhmol07G0147600 [Rhododendron molle]